MMNVIEQDKTLYEWLTNELDLPEELKQYLPTAPGEGTDKLGELTEAAVRLIRDDMLRVLDGEPQRMTPDQSRDAIVVVGVLIQAMLLTRTLCISDEYLLGGALDLMINLARSSSGAAHAGVVTEDETGEQMGMMEIEWDEESNLAPWRFPFPLGR